MKGLWYVLSGVGPVWSQVSWFMAGKSSGVGATQGFLTFLRLQCILAHSEVSYLKHVVYAREYFEEEPQGTLVLHHHMILIGEINPIKLQV